MAVTPLPSSKSHNPTMFSGLTPASLMPTHIKLKNLVVSFSPITHFRFSQLLLVTTVSLQFFSLLGKSFFSITTRFSQVDFDMLGFDDFDVE